MKPTRAILYVVVFALGIVAITLLNQRLIADRRAIGITQADPLINAPPLVSLTTVALGGFRGIIADIMWIRLTALQQEGKFFEIIQLADWITKLEPRSTEVWAYHAWNLAYNISVMIPDLPERWRWVDQGIRLLRDEGLRYNPGDARLFLELGWMYQNKIGAPYDEAHLLYKNQWAAEMNELLGGPRPDLHALASDTGRADRLRRAYKLEIDMMRKVESEYGPLNWLSPQAHAIYWAAQGLSRARGIEEITAAHRMIYQSMAEAVWQGCYQINPASGEVFPRPCFDLLPNAIGAYKTALTNEWGEPFVRTGYENFLRQSALLFFMYDRPETGSLIDQIAEFDPDLPSRGGVHQLLVETFLDESQVNDVDSVHGAMLFLLDKSIAARHFGDDEQARAFEKAATALRDRVLEKNPEIRLRTVEALRGAGK